MKPMPTTFEECQALQDGARSNWSGKLHHNTYLVWGEVTADEPAGADETLLGTMTWAVRLHATDIVTFYHDGRVMLNTNGWQTVTTRERMKRCGVCVWQDQGVTSVAHLGEIWTYADGIVLYPESTYRHACASVRYPAYRCVVAHPEQVKRTRRAELRRGECRPLDNRVSNHLPGGNVEQAFQGAA